MTSLRFGGVWGKGWSLSGRAGACRGHRPLRDRRGPIAESRAPTPGPCLYLRKIADGTVIWTSPTGHTYTTRPGSALLFPTLCLPTAKLVLPDRDTAGIGDRGLLMPKRSRTRAQERTARVDAERRLNDAHVAERNKPPPI